MGVVRWLNTVFLQLLLQRMCSQYVSEKKKCFPMEIYYAFVAFDISHLSARSGVQHTYKGSNVGAFVLLNLDPIRSVFCHSLTVVNFCWFSSHSVVVSLAWVHRAISRLIGAGICWLRFSGVCSKLLSQLSKSESLIVVGRIRNACHTDPVDFGNAALSLPTNNLSRPHGGGNITKSIYLTW